MDHFPLTRRRFFSTAALSGLALGLTLRSQAAPPPGMALKPATALKPGTGFAQEAARLTDACHHLFWDKTSQMYRAPVLSAETVASDARHDRGYTLWPSLIALHTLVEGEKQHPGRYAPQIAAVYDGLQQYYSPTLQAYTSWVRFPGNTDAYYDDNGWVVIVFVDAAEACRKSDPARSAVYLARAKTVMAEYVVKGYDASDAPGGVRWGSDPAKPGTGDRGTSSTAGAALAALLLARAGVDTKFYTAWGHTLLDWLSRRLRDTDSLVMDALVPPDWTVRRVKWTYNTGVPMRAYVEHYRLTKSQDSLAQASKMAHAAIRPAGALFDPAVHDPAKRFWWDDSYFVHYLADGLLQVAEVTPDPVLAASIHTTLVQNTQYAYTYLRDPADGFYWRNWRLYTIGSVQHARWQTWTGQTITPQFDPSERSQESRFQSLPVQKRPLVKTLLANAGAARLFWLASRLPATHLRAYPQSVDLPIMEA